ncbi:hypothetical protein JTB14_004279 [Gonioctena quinquepunctata]|nr:hypothetical protein JTB14_004279 [Gonioctena quinquepunctata]
MECFICKQPGHIASKCPNPPTINLLSQPTLSEQIAQVFSTNLIESDEVTPNEDQQINQTPAVLTPTQKRGHSQLSDPSENSSLLTETGNNNDVMPPPISSPLPKANKKKRKVSVATESNLTTSIKECMANAKRIHTSHRKPV